MKLFSIIPLLLTLNFFQFPGAFSPHQGNSENPNNPKNLCSIPPIVTLPNYQIAELPRPSIVRLSNCQIAELPPPSIGILAHYPISTLSTSLYSLSFINSNGDSVSLSSFAGKKILFVNIASQSSRVAQVGELQQLQQQHGDSLVIIAFPSNSFNHEPLSDSNIVSFYQGLYNIQYPLAKKSSVSDSAAITPVYHWLTQQSQNGLVTQPVLGDFQKFLVSEAGSLVGVFAPSVSPLSPDIQTALNQNYQ